MAIYKISFDDDYYQMGLNSLKTPGNYTSTFKTFSSARSANLAKTSNPNLQFSTTSKYLKQIFETDICDSNRKLINALVQA
jgi:hypothetical protein